MKDIKNTIQLLDAMLADDKHRAFLLDLGVEALALPTPHHGQTWYRRSDLACRVDPYVWENVLTGAPGLSGLALAVLEQFHDDLDFEHVIDIAVELAEEEGEWGLVDGRKASEG